jgi:hypothetical protein
MKRLYASSKSARGSAQASGFCGTCNSRARHHNQQRNREQSRYHLLDVWKETPRKCKRSTRPGDAHRGHSAKCAAGLKLSPFVERHRRSGFAVVMLMVIAHVAARSISMLQSGSTMSVECVSFFDFRVWLAGAYVIAPRRVGGPGVARTAF